jgi:hypothetical protein
MGLSRHAPCNHCDEHSRRSCAQPRSLRVGGAPVLPPDSVEVKGTEFSEATTVRNLGIEVDDARAIAGRVGI